MNTASARRGFTALVAVIGVAITGALTASGASYATQANLVEDYQHPEAARLEAVLGVVFGRGSGSLFFSECASGTGQIEIETLAPESPFCITVKRDGWLELEIPGAFGVRAGSGTLTVTSITGSDSTVTVIEPNQRRSIGASDGQASVVELSVRGTSTVSANEQFNTSVGASPYTAKLTSATSACSGVLMAPRWVLTTASCMSRTPNSYGTLTAGTPVRPTRAWFRLDTSVPPNNTGIAITRVEPYKASPSRDLALVQLDSVPTNVSPISIASSPAPVGTQVTFTGWGRTSSSWTPSLSHTFDVQATALTSTTFTVVPTTASRTFCVGDAGGPLVSGTPAAPVLYGVASQSDGGGCLLSDSSGTTGTVTRVDDVGAWISTIISSNP